MRVRLIRNPGSGSASDADDAAAKLRALGATVVEGEDVDRVVVVGGDGTVAPGAALAAQLGVPLAVVPAGTANDFARAHQLPEDVDEALALAARAGGPTLDLELGMIGDRPFVNAASAGLAPVAAERAEPLKGRLGPAAYAAGAALAGATEEPIAVAVSVEGREVYDGDAWQVIVASSGAFGGGADIQEADPLDGHLDLVVVPGTGRAALAKVALAMRRGTLAQLQEVVHARGTELVVRVPSGTAFNVDGEIVPSDGTARFSVRPRAFALLVPS